MYCLRMGKFYSVGAQGSFGGSEGGCVLVGHEHGAAFGVSTPELVHLDTPVGIALILDD